MLEADNYLQERKSKEKKAKIIAEYLIENGRTDSLTLSNYREIRKIVSELGLFVNNYYELLGLIN